MKEHVVVLLWIYQQERKPNRFRLSCKIINLIKQKM